MHRVANLSDRHLFSFHSSTCSRAHIRSGAAPGQAWLAIVVPSVAPIQMCCTSLQRIQMINLLLTNPDHSKYLQLSKIVWHFCSSNGNFCRFIQQFNVAWILKRQLIFESGWGWVSRKDEFMPLTASIWWQCHRATPMWARPFRLCQGLMTIFHWQEICVASTVNRAAFSRPLLTLYDLVPLRGIPNEDRRNAIVTAYGF